MTKPTTKELTLSNFKPLSAVRVNGQLCLTNEKGEPINRSSNEDEYARIHNIMRAQKLDILDAICDLFDQGASYADMFELVFDGAPKTIMSDKDKASAVNVWYQTWHKALPEYDDIATDIPNSQCPLCKEELNECPGHDQWVLDGSLLRQCSNGHIFANGRHPAEQNPIDECVIDEEKGVLDSCYSGFKPLCATGNLWKYDDKGNWVERRIKNG